MPSGGSGQAWRLIEFVRYFWPVLEPQTELVNGWPLEAICQHLEAVTFGEIKRLLMNVPPGFMKSPAQRRVLAGMGMGPDEHAASAVCDVLLRGEPDRAR
jgi:hypothetical protein